MMAPTGWEIVEVGDLVDADIGWGANIWIKVHGVYYPFRISEIEEHFKGFGVEEGTNDDEKE